MDGYEYNLHPRATYSYSIPSRDDPRSRSFSPTDHNLRNSDNPAIRDWLRHKERCLRIQRNEERQKRRDERKKEKSELEHKEAKAAEGVEKVEDWMKQKRKESRRLLTFRNNKENFVNIGRPQTAKPELVMTTTSLEFKRPSSAMPTVRSSDTILRRPRSAAYKPQVKREEEYESQIIKEDRRRISYEQWLQTKRKENEYKKLEEARRIRELKKTYQENDMDQIIPDMARNRIRMIESNKKRVNSGIKRDQPETKVQSQRVKQLNGTQGVRMYKWRPSSATVSSTRPNDEQTYNKYQLTRNSTDDMYGTSPYKLHRNNAPQRSASTRVVNSRYAEHIWNNFSDNVWRQVNDNGPRSEPTDEPKETAETNTNNAKSVEPNKKPGFTIEGAKPVEPLYTSQTESTESLSQKESDTTAKHQPGEKTEQSYPDLVKPGFKTMIVEKPKISTAEENHKESVTVEPPKASGTVTTNIPSKNVVVEKPPVPQQPNRQQRQQNQTETVSKTDVPKTKSHKSTLSLLEQITIAEELREAEKDNKTTPVNKVFVGNKSNNTSNNETKPVEKAPKVVSFQDDPEPKDDVKVNDPAKGEHFKPSEKSSSSTNDDVIILSQEGSYIGARSQPRRGSILKSSPSSGEQQTKKKKSVSFNTEPEISSDNSVQHNGSPNGIPAHLRTNETFFLTNFDT